jgi:hypothetical protein
MISVRWTKHLKSQEQKQKFEERLALAKDIWNVLRNIIQEDLDAIERDGLNKEHYFMPAWSEYQADRNGSKRALSKLLAIIPKGE